MHPSAVIVLMCYPVLPFTCKGSQNRFEGLLTASQPFDMPEKNVCALISWINILVICIIDSRRRLSITSNRRRHSLRPRPQYELDDAFLLGRRHESVETSRGHASALRSGNRLRYLPSIGSRWRGNYSRSGTGTGEAFLSWNPYTCLLSDLRFRSKSSPTIFRKLSEEAVI